MNRAVAAVAVLALAVLGAACATSFSPALIRAEIAQQTGADPARVFELNLGRVTMALARTVIGAADADVLPLAGLVRFELAVYEVPASGRPLDFTRMAIRGWEPTVRAKTPTGSTLVLVRSSGDDVGDLVVVAAGADKVVYGRLVGRLSRELPVALGRAVTEHGPEAVERELMALTEAPASSPAP